MTFDPFTFDPPAGALAANPYLFGPPVVRPPQFVDRRPELRRLAESVRSGHGATILLRGDFRVGKSSILRRFEHGVRDAAEPGRRDARGRRIECHAFSCEQLTFGAGESILARLCSLLGGVPPDEPGRQGSELTALLDRCAGDDRHPVFLIDEVALLPQIQGAATLVKLLRMLVDQYPVHFVVAGPFALQDPRMGWPPAASHPDLHHALDRLDQVTDTIQVGAFSVGSAVELIRLSESVHGTRSPGGGTDAPASAAGTCQEILGFVDVCASAPAGERVSLRGFEETVIELAGTIPYVLQATCSQLFHLLYEDPETRLDEEERAQRLLYLARTPRPVIHGDGSEGYVDGEGCVLREDRLKVLKQRVYDQLVDSYFEPLWNRLFDDAERGTLLDARDGRPADAIGWNSPAFRLRQKGYLRERGARLWLFSSLFAEFVRGKRPRPLRATSAHVLSLRIADRDDEPLTEASVIPARFSERIAELARRCTEKTGDEASLQESQHFFELLAQLLALLSQVAVIAYTAQPHMHRPELNNSLRQRQRRNPTLGTQLEHLQRILGLEDRDADDMLHRLARCLVPRRDAAELPAQVVGLIRRVTRSGNTRLSPMDFLEVCVRLRNLQGHPENRPAGTTAQAIRRMTLDAVAGLHELVELLSRETRGMTVLGLAAVDDKSAAADAAAPTIPLATLFARRPWVAMARLEGQGDRTLSGTVGEMYTALVDAAPGGGERIRLQDSSLVPLIVDGATLRTAIGDSHAAVAADAVYVLAGTPGGGLRFAPLGDPRGDRVEIRGNGAPHPLIERYEALFEQLR
jgi:hypothetical protein